VRTGCGVRTGSGEAAGVGVTAGAGDGTGVAGSRPGCGAGAGTGAARDGARGDEGKGSGPGLPGGSPAAAGAERSTEHSTRPQKAAWVAGRPPDSFIRTIPAEPPSRTRPAAAHTAGYCPRVISREFLRLLNDDSSPGGGSAGPLDGPSGMWFPLLTRHKR